MNGWAVALILGVVAAVYIETQNIRLNELAARMHKAEALVESYELQRENTERFDGIDKELRNGGENVLSDYMRDSAGKLWPAP